MLECEGRDLYRVTVALDGARAGDLVCVEDATVPEIAELIEATFLVKVESGEPQAPSEELAAASTDSPEDAPEQEGSEGEEAEADEPVGFTSAEPLLEELPSPDLFG